MLVYVCEVGMSTICATTQEEAQLYFWDFVPTVEQLIVSDSATHVYRVYSHSLDLNIYVETLDEAKTIIQSYKGQQRRSIRRWKVPIQGQQLTLF